MLSQVASMLTRVAGSVDAFEVLCMRNFNIAPAPAGDLPLDELVVDNIRASF
jgi:hypothetical protein